LGQEKYIFDPFPILHDVLSIQRELVGEHLPPGLFDRHRLLALGTRKFRSRCGPEKTPRLDHSLALMELSAQERLRAIIIATVMFTVAAGAVAGSAGAVLHRQTVAMICIATQAIAVAVACNPHSFRQWFAAAGVYLAWLMHGDAWLACMFLLNCTLLTLPSEPRAEDNLAFMVNGGHWTDEHYIVVYNTSACAAPISMSSRKCRSPDQTYQ
jgi:hypothetical protein